MLIRWIDRKGQAPRVPGYIEEVKEKLALAWIKRGICEAYSPPNRKAAVVAAPPKTTAEASPVPVSPVPSKRVQFPGRRQRKG